MIALELEQALRQLEQTTLTLLSTGTADLVALSQALDDRADAITKVALIAGATPENRTSALERISKVLVQGEEATRRLFDLRRQASEEWGRVSRLEQSVSEAPARPEVDCEG